ncbi:MAG: hypothetical protein JO011_22690 [Ktedonobacteraceae bacterium]|nr:hypothetical protein [Ktedonobacteraceae bacterium]MBV9713716.1 hypothetical protein [Ktedonobacteraceae bacterium]
MESNVQQEIALACNALLAKNASDPHKAGNCSNLSEPKTKREAIALLVKAGSDPDITFGNVTDALWTVYMRHFS